MKMGNPLYNFPCPTGRLKMPGTVVLPIRQHAHHDNSLSDQPSEPRARPNILFFKPRGKFHDAGSHARAQVHGIRSHGGHARVLHGGGRDVCNIDETRRHLYDYSCAWNAGVVQCASILWVAAGVLPGHGAENRGCQMPAFGVRLSEHSVCMG